MARQLPAENAIPSSSPGFATPAHTILPKRLRAQQPTTPSKRPILPILLPPAILRPIAFRVFTKKHNLTINSSTLQTLAAFVGKHCGSGWREEGLAEQVLEEVAKLWKTSNGGAIVEDGQSGKLTSILQNLEGSMEGGKVTANPKGRRVAKEKSTPHVEREVNTPDGRSLSNGGSALPYRGNRQSEPSAVDEENEDGVASTNVRKYIKVVNAFEQPRLVYNVNKMHFDVAPIAPSLFPSSSQRSAVFRDRYNLVHQRLLRNDVFYMSSFSYQSTTNATGEEGDRSYKLTAIANLLGRTNSSHLLLGMLSRSPAGGILLSDLTGSIFLDLSHAKAVPQDGVWFTMGMIVVVDGIYLGEEGVNGSGVGNNEGVGGTVGGQFYVISIAGPPCERRDASLGAVNPNDPKAKAHVDRGFGWVDFLGVGSQRGLGVRMRQAQKRCLLEPETRPNEDPLMRRKVIVLGEVLLDDSQTLSALEMVLNHYNDEIIANIPPVFILVGNFTRHAMMSGGTSGGSIDYKGNFDLLATILSRYPLILRNATFIFVPGDNDPWAAAHSAGASTTIPRDGLPSMFTTRVQRAFQNANKEVPSQPGSVEGTAIWASNPTRVALFGPVTELLVFRDDMSGRLRRNALLFKNEPEDEDDGMDIDASGTQEHHHPDGDAPDFVSEKQHVRTNPTGSSIPESVRVSRKLVKTILDQGNLSPFPLSVRSVLWSYASSLNMYPLPSALLLADSEADPFTITYEGCHVMNPGKLVPEGSKSIARWVEYDMLKNRGTVIQDKF